MNTEIAPSSLGAYSEGSDHGNAGLGVIQMVDEELSDDTALNPTKIVSGSPIPVVNEDFLNRGSVLVGRIVPTPACSDEEQLS